MAKKVNVRLTYRAEVYIEADTLAEARDKWESMDLFSNEAMKHDAAFVELVSVEDEETYKDLFHEWVNAYDKVK